MKTPIELQSGYLYMEEMRFSANLGGSEEVVFVGFPCIGQRNGKAVLEAYAAPLRHPESYEYVTMTGTTSVLRAYQATVMCRDLFRMRIDEHTGTSLTFDELIVALDSDDCGIRYGFFGDLADDFRMTPNEFIEALEMCRALDMPVGELMSFGEAQTYQGLRAQLDS